MLKITTLAIHMIWTVLFAGLIQFESSDRLIQSIAPTEPIFVEAKVMNLREDGQYVIGALEITHAYCGGNDLIGKTFDVYSSKSGMGNMSKIIFPPLRDGERGIWSIKVKDGNVTYSLYPIHGISWPARESISPRYDQAKILAESIEQVCGAKSDERSEMLRTSAFSPVSEVSAWAIHAIAGAKPQTATEAFYTEVLKSNNLSIGGQIALDEVLSEIKGSSWRISEERMDLLNRLVDGAAMEYEAGLIDNRLSVIVQRGEMDDRTLLNLLKKFADNQRFPVASRQNNIRLMGIISKRSKDEGMAFRQLIEVIEVSKEDEMKVAAARTIKNFVAIDKDRLPVIQNLNATTTNKRVADALEEAIKRPNNQ
jgi:hypothetical protein